MTICSLMHENGPPQNSSHLIGTPAFKVKYGAVEGAAMNVRVNGIAPGTVRTPLSLTIGEEKLEETWKKTHLTGKPIMVEDVS